MSNGAFPGLLGVVVIDSLNKTFRVTYDGVAANLSMAEGIYFVRGDNSADDFCKAFIAGLNTHAGLPAFDIGVPLFQVLAADPNFAWTIVDNNAKAFTIHFGHASTSLDASLIGFPVADAVSVAAEVSSSLSSSAVWIGNDIYRSLEANSSWSRRSSRALSGKVRAVSRRDEIRDLIWVQEYIHEKRFNEEAITADPHRAFNRFLQRHAGGPLRFEFHDVELDFDIADGQATFHDGFTIVDTLVFSDDFYPDNQQFGVREDGAPLYSFQGRLLPYVA